MGGRSLIELHATLKQRFVKRPSCLYDRFKMRRIIWGTFSVRGKSRRVHHIMVPVARPDTVAFAIPFPRKHFVRVRIPEHRKAFEHLGGRLEDIVAGDHDRGLLGSRLTHSRISACALNRDPPTSPRRGCRAKLSGANQKQCRTFRITPINGQ